MAQFIGFHFVWNWRTWANHTHITSEHIEQLRNFIEAQPPQHTSHASYARIVSKFIRRLFLIPNICFRMAGNKLPLILTVDFAIGIYTHGAELVDQKYSTIHSHALLRIKCGTLGIKFY